MKEGRGAPSLVLLLLIYYSIVIIAAAKGDLIDETCRMTPFYDLCVTTLRSNTGSGVANTTGLAEMVINSLLVRSGSALITIQELIRDADSPQIERPLTICSEIYKPVVRYVLPQALETLARGDVNFSSYSIIQVRKAADDCDRNFSGFPLSPVAAIDEAVRDLAAVAACILAQLFSLKC